MIMLCVRMFCICLIIFLVSCKNKPGEKEYWEINSIPISNPDQSIPISKQNERMAKFSSYSVDKQIDIYLYSQFEFEGASDSFFRYMVSDGQNKIDFIVERIDKTNDPMEKVGLIRALDFIDENCRCVNNKSGNLNILIKNEMQINEADSKGIRGFKELYSEYLQKMRSRQ